MKKFILIFFSLFIFSSAIAENPWNNITFCDPQNPENNACGEGCYLRTQQCIPCEVGFYNDNNQNTDRCKQCTIIPDGADWVPDITGMMSNSCPWEITCNADSYWDSGTKQCKACATGYHSAAQTIQGAGNESESTSCDIYEITLVDGGTPIGTAYAKKGKGYANNLNGPWPPNGPITPLPNYPDKWWQRFTGYLKEGQDFTDSDGYVRSPFISADQISGPFTATAKWQYAKFNIQFNLEGSVEPLVEYTNCTLGDEENPCLAPTADDIEESIPDGQHLAYWICNDPIGGVYHCKNGEKVSPGDPITPNIVLESGTDFGDNSGQFVVLEAYFTTCNAPLGKYCTEDGKHANCPQGTTTLSEGATSIAECVMVGGSNGTNFCDKENRCFNLPEGTNIQYTGSF